MIESCTADHEIKRLLNAFIQQELESPSYPTYPTEGSTNYITALKMLIDFCNNLNIKDFSLPTYKSFQKRVSEITNNSSLKSYLYKLLPKFLNHFIHNTTMTSLVNIKSLLEYEGLCLTYVRNYTLGTALVRENLADAIITSPADNEVKRLLDEFVQKELENPSYLYENAKNGVRDFFAGIKHLVSIIGSLHITEISWKTYCFYQQRINNIVAPLNLHNEIRGKLNLLLPDVFKYIVNNTTEIGLKNIQDLKDYEHYLYVNEKLNLNKNSSKYPLFMLTEIYSNFPLESHPSRLFLFEYAYMNRNKKLDTKTLVNLNSDTVFIKEILISFIKTFNRDINCIPKATRMEIRVFLYFFENSLYTLNELPQKVEDFTFETFKKQFRFYTKMDEKFPVSIKLLVDVLKEFYIFLTSYIHIKGINHNLFKGTAINISVLSASVFNSTYRQGYRFVLQAPHEDAPIYDKLCIVSNGAPSARATDINTTRLDFNKIYYKQFKDDVRNFIWSQSSKYIGKLNYVFSIIVDFLNLKYEYDLQQDNIIRLDTNKDEVFTEDFMFTYMSIILNKYESDKTIANIFSPVKSFLLYYKEKYNYDETLNDYLRYTQPIFDGSNGGIAVEDFNLISDEFKKLKNESLIGELLFIILYLKARTRLRIGEILNLQRKCIVNIDEKSCSGTVEHYGKTEDEKITTEITQECIEFIQRAEKLTKDFSNNAINKESKDFIFIKPVYNHKNEEVYNVISLSTVFYNTFYSILENLGFVGKYNVYSIRHMRKNQVLNSAIKAGHDMQTIIKAIGGTPQTNYKSYINSQDVKLYVELFTGTIISNVNINGEIVIDETIINNLNAVNGNLGGCRQEKCTKDKPSSINLFEKYPFYKCLICESFITSLAKADTFEYYINAVKDIKKHSTDNEEINDCQILLQLLGAYFERQLSMLQNQGGISNVSD